MEKAKVLVVEDQRIISLEIKERVEDLGYEVIAIVKTGEQAIQFAKDLKPDLILMDIRLEGEMDGIEAAGIIKETIDCPIIFLTAYADDKTIQRAKIAQPYGYIVKPLDERELRSAIEIALYKSSIEKKLKDSEIKYRTIVNTLEGSLYMVDEQYNLILSNLSLESVIKGADSKGKKCYELIYKSKSVCRHCPLDLLKEGKTTRTEVFEPETLRWFYRVSTPLNLSEKKTYFQHLLVDITERKRNEENALNALNEKEVLLREIHHRVKNNLQLMLSLIRLQELNSSDKAVKTNLRAIENRLNSMVLVHENLYSASDLAKIPFKEYIDKLTAHLVRVFGMDVKNVKIKSEIDDLFMSIDYAIPLGIIINELITNSIKHAFPEGISGNIIIKFYKKDNNYFLDVIDDGSGLPENTDFDKPKALGMQIIKSLCSQLDGNASYSTQDGCHFNLTLKNIDKASHRKT